jgi:hypothetical protein
MTGAACAEGPAPVVTFLDLPRHHRNEVLRFALVGAASTAYFVAVAILAAPLPSRSLAANAALPHPGIARSSALEATFTPPAIDVPPVRPRAIRARPLGALAALREPAGDPAPVPALAALRDPAGDPSGDPAPTPAPPRRNAVSRFFHGVFHSLQPARARANSL